MTQPPFGFVPLSQSLPYWPSDLFGEPEILNEIGLRDFVVSQPDPDHLSVSGTLLWFQEFAIDIPGLEGVSVAFLSGNGYSALPFQVDVLPSFALAFPSLSFSLRIRSSLIKPVRKDADGKWVPVVDATGKVKPAQIDFSGVGVRVAATGDVDVIMPAGAPQIGFGPVAIGDSGLVLEVHGLAPYLSASQTPPPGAPPGFRGIALKSAKLYLPADLDIPLEPSSIQFDNLLIGTGGFSGTIQGNWTPTFDTATNTYSGNGSGALFGIPFGLRSLSLTLKQNVPTGSNFKGELLLPFFSQPVMLDLGLSGDGSFHVGLSAVQPAGVTSSSGLISFERPGLLKLQLDGLGFEKQGDLYTVKLSGRLKPLLGGIDWPEFQVKNLSIDSKGNVRLEGGWLDLGTGYALDFYGFRLEITKLGFGKTEDGGKWIGFSGGLKLVDGMPAGASVEGLRITWYEDGRQTKITLNGVGVEFEIPEVLKFKGAVSYRELTITGPNGPEQVHRFDGDIKLSLISLDLEISATLVVGTSTDALGTYTFFAIYLGVELPAGIPLFATGLGLYGMAGLFALQMEPDKHPDEEWFAGWYHRPTIGVTDLKKKWINRRDSLALGAGVTIGTLADNGYTFAGKFLLVIVFPGPILLIEGKANLLKERAKLTDDPIFRALVVLDNRAGTFLMGLDAKYKYDDAGSLISIKGSAEAFFDFHDADKWHLYVGQKDPKEKRIQAEIFKLFHAEAYLMIDHIALATGAWIGFDKHWGFGPLSVTVQAWIQSDAILSWKPVQLHGELWLHGNAALKVFGFGISLSADARIVADVFEPFHLLGDFKVGIGLPWPLPSFSAHITLEWGPTPTPPRLPLPLKEIAVEHFKSTASWPLPRASLLLPSYDSSGDGFLEAPQPSVAAAEALAPPAQAPVVPLDARPHITFGRAVNDDALVGVNVQPVTPEWERIGDPAHNEGPVRARYAVAEVALHKYVAGSWELIARKGSIANTSGVSTLYGSWAPMPQLPSGSGANVGQVKLWLWSKTPFDFTRNTGGAWDEWFTAAFPDYPCIPPATDRIVCCDFERVALIPPLHSPWSCPDQPRLKISWLGADEQVTALSPSVAGLTHALCVPGSVTINGKAQPNEIRVDLAEPAQSVELTVVEPTVTHNWQCIDFRTLQPAAGPNPKVIDQTVFLVRDGRGMAVAQTQLAYITTTTGRVIGLNCGFQTIVDLPCTAEGVQVTLTHMSSPAVLVAEDAAGNVVAKAQMTTVPRETQTVPLQASGIRRVRILARQDETWLHEVCFLCEAGTSLQATGIDAAGNTYGPFYPSAHLIEVVGTKLVGVRLRGDPQICLTKVCANLGPDPQDVHLREEYEQHLQEEIARWSSTGEVLEPDSDYRIKVVTTLETADFAPDPGFNQIRWQTEFAYFRTHGAPGLTTLTPPAQADPANSSIGLEDLTHYVRQTVPPTVPAAGERPPLPRPVFRAYDVGAEFNEDYVDLMYRISRRDLGLYLYDNNNRPVRDAAGRLIVLANEWGVTEQLTLDASDTRWISTIDGSDCLNIDTTVIPHDRTLTAAREGQVLDADTVYEGRLVPLLLHEDWTKPAVGAFASGPSGTLGGWTVLDQGSNLAPSKWTIGEIGTPASRYVAQTTSIWGGLAPANEPAKPGTLLLAGDATWDDYRLSVFVRSSTDGAVGVVFRYVDASNYYRVSYDRAGYRRLVSVVDGVLTVLGEDDFTYQTNTDYLLTIEAVGSALRVYEDGALVFAVDDEALPAGKIGLYSWKNPGVRFTDVRVDDFRATAPIVYRFKFTTSKYANFLHLLHSFEDETWKATLDPATALDAQTNTALAAAADPATLVADPETRAYESLADLALAEAARQEASVVEATRVERGSQAIALLVRSPEPISWSRAALNVLRSPTRALAAIPPGRLKLISASFASSSADDESLTVLLRERDELDGTRIDLLQAPGPFAAADEGSIFRDDFADPAGVVFEERFGSRALDHYNIVDQGTSSGPSHWMAGAEIVQDTNIYGGSIAATAIEKPGTLALQRAHTWRDLRITAKLRSDDDDSIGLVFRYVDGDNYYRFSIDSERAYRRLVKFVGGAATLLWQDNYAYSVGQAYTLVLEAVGPQLVGSIDGQLLFAVTDKDLSIGRVGWYCWANVAARFQRLTVETPPTPLILWQPALVDRTGLDVVDDPAATGGPSAWAAASGTLSQTAVIAATSAEPAAFATYALAHGVDVDDATFAVRLASTGAGAIGVIFRYQDDDNYYRFSMHRSGGYRRLIRKFAGVVSVLWQDPQIYDQNRKYDLTIAMQGSSLRGFLDGAALFAVRDGVLTHGRVGFYTADDGGASFEQVAVINARRQIGVWRVRDETDTGGPSVWVSGNGLLRQSGSIGDFTAPDFLGTVALAGEATGSNYRVRAQMSSDGAGVIGLVFRSRDSDNEYRLGFDHPHGNRRLVKRTNGISSVLWQQSQSYAPGTPFELAVTAVGSRLRGFVDGAPLFDLVDTDHPAGAVGLYVSGDPTARFTKVRLSAPSLDDYALFRDAFADGSTSGFTFVDEGTAAAPSSWSINGGVLTQTSDIFELPIDRTTLAKHGTNALAGDPAWTDVILRVKLRSEDDDAIGVLFRYQDTTHYYRFSMDSQRGYRRLVKNVGGTFTQLWEDAVAYEVGREYEVVILAVGSELRGFIDRVPVFVVGDPDIASGRVGLYTWGNHDARFISISVYPASQRATDFVLDEHFASDTGRWTFIDQGTPGGPSTWTFGGSELRQTSGIEDGSAPTDLVKAGTLALTGDRDWINYRASFRLRSDADGSIGVLVRYADPDHWCRFSMDRRDGYRRLVKNEDGVLSLLWSDAVAYEIGREYILTIDCIDDRITGYVNGVRLFSVEDATIRSGGIGLYAWRNGGARFAEVRVAAATWRPYFEFDRELPLPAGTQIRIFSGGESSTPAPPAGVTHRFRASLGDRGVVSFPAEGVIARVVRRSGLVEHQHRFEPDSTFSSVAFKVLRKADGTGFFVIPTAPPLAAGTYRLALVYRRNNTAADPGSQVLRQAGDNGDEHVVVDVPWVTH